MGDLDRNCSIGKLLSIQRDDRQGEIILDLLYVAEAKLGRCAFHDILRFHDQDVLGEADLTQNLLLISL